MDHAQLLATTLALLVVVPVARIGAKLAALVNQPRVIGEIVCGLAVGAGAAHFAPHWLEAGGGMQGGSALSVIAQLGIVFMMFHLGMEFDFSHMRQAVHRRTVASISILALAVPFACGVVMTALYATATGSSWAMAAAVFCGIAFAVTALPVLARILVETGLSARPLGTVAIACAAIIDIASWVALGVLAVAQTAGEASVSGVAAKLALVGVFLATVFLVFRPLAGACLARLEQRRGEYSHDHIAAALVVVLAASAGSAMLGLHGALGAFAVGVALYDQNGLRDAWHREISPLVYLLLVPIFFMFTGARIRFGDLGVQDLVWGLAWITAACASKVASSFIGARMAGLASFDALRLGLLLNTRGLTELVVLNIGLDLGLISSTLFTFLVAMALVSTVATVPLVRWLERSVSHLPLSKSSGMGLTK